MKQKTAYIAGPVSGRDIETVARQFSEKKNALVALGYNVINPVAIIQNINAGRDIPLTDEQNRREIIAICLNALVRFADELHLLPGWEESAGAGLERSVALRMGIKVVY